MKIYLWITTFYYSIGLKEEVVFEQKRKKRGSGDGDEMNCINPIILKTIKKFNPKMEMISYVTELLLSGN